MWKPVYLIVGLMIVLLILVSGSALSPTWAGLLEGIIVIVGLGLVTFWLDMNPSSFIAAPPKKLGSILYEYPPVKELKAERSGIVQPYPDSGKVAAPQLVIDHRRIRDLTEQREENLKWSLN